MLVCWLSFLLVQALRGILFDYCLRVSGSSLRVFDRHSFAPVLHDRTTKGCELYYGRFRFFRTSPIGNLSVLAGVEYCSWHVAACYFLLTCFLNELN